MADIIEMPKLSDTMETGVLVAWLKNEGDAVSSGDIIAEIETDKATMEVESFFAQLVKKVKAFQKEKHQLLKMILLLRSRQRTINLLLQQHK
jgi:pyruvate dehydrogenase E2 component (dihydrolipoamide acetyltransferase)